jgi:thioredoxin 1
MSPRLFLVRHIDACRVFTGAGAVNDDTWEELVLKSSVPVLVDFWAPWCGPCRMIAPIIDEIAQEYGDKLKAVKLNTDESPQVATEYGIRSIPTVMVFKDGQKMDAVIGAVPKSTLVQTIEKYMN